MTTDSDGRSSQQSYLADLHDVENHFKENYDFDGNFIPDIIIVFTLKHFLKTIKM